MHLKSKLSSIGKSAVFSQLAKGHMPLIADYYNTILHLHSKRLLKSLAALHNTLKFLAFSYIWLPLVLRPTCSSLIQVNMHS